MEKLISKNITILIISIVVVAFGVSIIYKSGNAEPGNNSNGLAVASAISVDREFHDFGEINIFGGNVETDFELTNSGGEMVVIKDGTTSCGCTEGEIDGIRFGMHQSMSNQVSILPGETKTVTAIYDPLAHGPNATGKITRQVMLSTNSASDEQIVLKITANVVK